MVIMESKHKRLMTRERKSAMRMIDDDVLPEILKRLTAVDICRYRSVCKSWNSLITSPYFIDLHHSYTRNSTTTPDNRKPYLIPDRSKDSHEFYTLYDPNTNPSVPNTIHFPITIHALREESRLTYIDVIHGIVCVSYPLDSSFDSTILWNPAIHKYFSLPYLPFPSNIDKTISEEPAFANAGNDPLFHPTARFYSNAIGFGYDECSKDFKVVRVWMNRDYTKLYGTSIPTTYEVYSHSKGVWRAEIAQHIHSFMFDISTSRTGCYVNGTIHWLVSSYDFQTCSILTFDCESEELTTMELPEELYGEIDPWVGRPLFMYSKLSEYVGMLSLLVQIDRGDDYFDLWVMEKHGLCTTWKKLFRIFNPFSYPNDYELFQQILNGRVYKESLFFIDHPTAHSYTNDDLFEVA